MTNTDKRARLINMFALLIDRAMDLGIRVIVTSFYRSAAEQNALYVSGKSKCDGYTKKSKHQSWLAIDIAVVLDDGTVTFEDIPAYTTLGEFWEGLGGTWGGRWPSLRDIYHFEYKDK